MGNILQPVVINGETFFNYSDFFPMLKITWSEEPSRSLSGAMTDINEIERFVVPMLFLDFQYLSIEDYRRLLRAISPPEFTVTFYNIETDSVEAYKMYVHPLERMQIHNYRKNLLAVKNITLTLVGTLNDVTTLNITYLPNGASGAIAGASGYYGQTMQISSGSTLSNGTKKFTGWNTKADGTGTFYQENSFIVLTSNLILYAMWNVNNTHTIFFDYQNADEIAKLPVSKAVTESKVIGELPLPKKVGYEFGGWFSHINGQGTEYMAQTVYDVKGDIAVFAYWIKK